MRTVLQVNPFAPPAGVEYVLKRSNLAIAVWLGKTKEIEVLYANYLETTINFGSDPKYLWVEWVVPNLNIQESYLEFQARQIGSDTVIKKDTIRFFRSRVQ